MLKKNCILIIKNIQIDKIEKIGKERGKRHERKKRKRESSFSNACFGYIIWVNANAIVGESGRNGV